MTAGGSSRPVEHRPAEASPAGAGPAVPLFDLRMEPEDLAAAEAVLRSGRLRAGEQVEAFEREFAAHVGVRHAVALSSCTAALHLAYLATGVGAGDEVVVPAITFVASAAAVRYCGGTPVFADVRGDGDVGVDPDDVRRRITSRTRAVCAVHYAGYPAAVDVLRGLCDEHGLSLVEDAAHAPDADLDGRRLGSWGAAGCFSFFSNKVLAVGEGGLLTTDDDRLAERVRELRSGPYNLRLDDVRAALLRSRMRRMADDVARRRRLTRRYREKLRDLDEVVVPYTDEEVGRSSCYVMPVVLAEPGRQSAVRAWMLQRHGVQTSLLYPAVHEFTAYRQPGAAALPRAERIARCEVTLPLHGLLTEDEQDRVVVALRDALRHAGGDA